MRTASIAPRLVLLSAAKQRASVRRSSDRHRSAASAVLSRWAAAQTASSRAAATPDLVLITEPLLKLTTKRKGGLTVYDPCDLPLLASTLQTQLVRLRETRALAELVQAQLKHLLATHLPGAHKLAETTHDDQLPLALHLHEQEELFEESLRATDQTLNAATCDICLEPVNEGGPVCILPCRCFHRHGRALHAECFNSLIGSRDSAPCPICQEHVLRRAADYVEATSIEELDASRRQRAESMRAQREKLITPRMRDLTAVTRLATEAAGRCSHPSSTTGKCTALIDLLLDHGRIPASDKVVVFTAVKETLPLLHEVLTDAGVLSLSPTLRGKCAIATFRASAERALLLQAGDGTSGLARRYRPAVHEACGAPRHPDGGRRGAVRQARAPHRAGAQHHGMEDPNGRVG